MKLTDYFADGVARDQEWVIANYEYLQEELHKDMRAKGFIPVLDIPMKTTFDYDVKTGNMKYRLTAKGQGVGCKKAKRYLGILSKEGIMLDIDVKEAELV